MTKSRKRREFSDAFKLQVLSEYFSGGGSKLSVARKYGLSHGLLLAWMKKWPVDSKCLSLPEEIINTYKMAHPNVEFTAQDALEKRIADLEKALEYERLRNYAYKKLIDIAEAEEGISILKKGGVKQ